jgi:hypothetical protein
MIQPRACVQSQEQAAVPAAETTAHLLAALAYKKHKSTMPDHNLVSAAGSVANVPPHSDLYRFARWAADDVIDYLEPDASP